VTGRTLRFSRLRRGLRQGDVAEVAGCSRTRIGQIENLARVPPAWVLRYRAAVDRADAMQSAPRSARVTPGAGTNSNRPGRVEGGAG
jgi:transcriptional regulator with XRE-family HTH domain